MKFFTDDSGAVSIDWVAMTAGILLLGILIVYNLFNTGVTAAVSGVTATLDRAGDIEIGPQPNINGD